MFSNRACLRWCITKLHATLANGPLHTHSLLGNVLQKLGAAFSLRMIFTPLLNNTQTSSELIWLESIVSHTNTNDWPYSGRRCEPVSHDSFLLCSHRTSRVSEPEDGDCKTQGIENDLSNEYCTYLWFAKEMHPVWCVRSLRTSERLTRELKWGLRLLWRSWWFSVHSGGTVATALLEESVQETPARHKDYSRLF